MILCCNILSHSLQPLQPCRQWRGGFRLCTVVQLDWTPSEAVRLWNILWKLGKWQVLPTACITWDLRGGCSLAYDFFYFLKKQQPNMSCWVDLYSHSQDAMLIDLNVSAWSARVFCHGCALFCKCSFTYTWYNYCLYDRDCSVPSLLLKTACSHMLLPQPSQLSKTYPIRSRPVTGGCDHNIAEPR